MKVSYVVPRYGERVFGGAENACRLLAEHLVAETGWEVEVFTSTATDSATWADELEPGTTVETGVTVHRFRGTPRHPDFVALSEPVLASPETVPRADQERWIERQGPASAELVEAVAASDGDVTCFTPYLFHPVVAGLPRAPRPRVLQPAMHDETPARLSVVADVFAAADAHVFYSEPERRVAERLHPAAVLSPQIVLGLGVDEGGGEPVEFRRRFDLGERPYLLYVGRIDRGKGIPPVARLFAAYKDANPGPLTLVLAGQVVDGDDLPRRDDIVVTGLVDEATKWGGYRGALAHLSPSRYESFSLLLMEGWLAGSPAIVNAACAVTTDHVRRSGGGFAVARYLEFEAAVELLLRDRAARDRLADAGRRYVIDRFRWPDVIARYRRFLEQVAAE